MSVGIVYEAISPSGKKYIGQTTRSLAERKRQHKKDMKKLKTSFSFALKKYGFHNFTWNILYDGVPKNMLSTAEICAIYLNNTFCAGYNETFGGEGITYTKCIRDKMRKNHWTKGPNAEKIKEQIRNKRKKWLNEGGREIISKTTKEAMKNPDVRRKCSYWNEDNMTQEMKRKMQEGFLKVVKTDAYRKKMSESITKWWQNKKQEERA